MKRIVWITALCFASLQPAAFASGNHNLTKALRGDFAFSGAGGCIQSNQSFNGYRTPDGGFTRSHSVRGIRHFNGDGTGTVSGTSISIGFSGYTDSSTTPPTPHPSAYGPYFTHEFSTSFTYTVAPDRISHRISSLPPLPHHDPHQRRQIRRRPFEPALSVLARDEETAWPDGVPAGFFRPETIAMGPEWPHFFVRWFSAASTTLDAKPAER